MTDFSTHLLALAPLVILCATVVGVMLSIAVRRNHFTAATMTVVGLNAALLSLLALAPLVMLVWLESSPKAPTTTVSSEMATE